MKIFVTDHIASLPILHAWKNQKFHNDVEVIRHPSWEGILALAEGGMADAFELPPTVFFKNAERLDLYYGTTLCQLDYTLYIKERFPERNTMAPPMVPVLHEFSLERLIFQNNTPIDKSEIFDHVRFFNVPLNKLEQSIHVPNCGRIVLDSFVFSFLGAEMEGYQEYDVSGNKNLPVSILCFRGSWVRNHYENALEINQIIEEEMKQIFTYGNRQDFINEINEADLLPAVAPVVFRNFILKQGKDVGKIFSPEKPDWQRLKKYFRSDVETLCSDIESRHIKSYPKEDCKNIENHDVSTLVSLEIEQFTMKVLAGNLDARMNASDSLARKINAMMSYLQNTIQVLEYEKDKLENLNSILEIKLDRSSVNLQFSEEKYRYLFEYSSEPLIIVNPETGHIVDSNREFRRQTGYSRTNLNSLRLEDIIVDDDSIIGHRKSHIKIDTMLHIPEIQIIKKDGSIITLDADVNSFILSSSKKYQIRFQDSFVKNESEKLKHEFISNISHELRSPMTNITGYFELLRSDPSLYLPEDTRDTLNVIERNIRRLNELINNLLKLESLQKENDEHMIEVFFPAEVIEEALDANRNQIHEKKLEINVNLDKNLAIEGIKFEFYQVVSNLLVNAIKYTEKGSVAVSLFQDNHENAILVVKDTGVGIDPIHHKAIFERFYRVPDATNRRIGGTGLGLSIITSLLKKIGGNITVDSGLGQGSEFKITIPLVQNWEKHKEYII